MLTGLREIIPGPGKRIVIEPDGTIKYQQRGPLPGPAWIKAKARNFTRDERRRAERIAAGRRDACPISRRAKDGPVGTLSSGV